jgi:predicted anti-sigma-YlaC factor YlaD
MACQEYRDFMMAYLDNELDETDRQRFQDHLQTCPVCSREFEEFGRLKTMTDGMALAEPEDRIWEDYWNQVYNRTERNVGWILFSLAAIGLLIYGGIHCIENLIASSQVAIVLKCMLLVLVAGLAILFVSVLRERLFFWRRDRYRDVRR